VRDIRTFLRSPQFYFLFVVTVRPNSPSAQSQTVLDILSIPCISLGLRQIVLYLAYKGTYPEMSRMPFIVVSVFCSINGKECREKCR
jgi:hypothetical protein